MKIATQAVDPLDKDDTDTSFYKVYSFQIFVAVLLVTLAHLWTTRREFQQRRRRQQVEGATSSTSLTEKDAKGERLLRSRLLQGSLPTDLVLEESVEHREKKHLTPTQKKTKIRTKMNEIKSQGQPAPDDWSLNKERIIPVVERDDEEPTLFSERLPPTAMSTPTGDDSGGGKTKATLTSTSSSTRQAETQPFSPNATEDHPGLDAFWHWWDVEASLFRIYCIGRTDSEVAPPYAPTSYRGTVQVALEVRNEMSQTVSVYWVSYRGREVFKGEIPAGAKWMQTTYVDHPWVFRSKEGHALLHYIPYRIIPTTELEPTVDPANERVGLHRFTLRDAHAPFRCRVDDPVLPFPAEDHLLSPDNALSWTLHHCHRMGYLGWRILHKYLTKIVRNPNETKYRQIRIENSVFHQNVWNTTARGLLFAVGFVEHGAFVEFGSARPLSSARVRHLEQLLTLIEEWRVYAELGIPIQQPNGADGYGRAGFGRIGGMNDRNDRNDR